MAAPRVLSSRNRVHNDGISFEQLLGIAGDQVELEGRRWRDAAVGTRDKVVASGSDGLESAVQAGSHTIEWARLVTGKAAEGLSKRLLRKGTEHETGENVVLDNASEQARRSLTSRSTTLPTRGSGRGEPEDD